MSKKIGVTLSDDAYMVLAKWATEQSRPDANMANHVLETVLYLSEQGLLPEIPGIIPLKEIATEAPGNLAIDFLLAKIKNSRLEARKLLILANHLNINPEVLLQLYNTSTDSKESNDD